MTKKLTLLYDGIEKGLLTGFGPGGHPSPVPFWYDGPPLRRNGAKMWYGDDRAIEALIRVHCDAHQKAGMKPYRDLADQIDLEGKTWIICGSGPSLKRSAAKYVSQFNEDKKDIIWVAVNGAQRMVTSHIFFCLDRHMEPRWWSDVEEMPEKYRPYLVCSPMSDMRVLDAPWKGRYYFYTVSCNRETPEFTNLGHLVSNKVTVTTAMDLAYRCGAERIILLGNECAHDEDGRRYFDSPLKKVPENQMLHSGYVNVKGIDGKPCWINADLYHTAGIIEATAEVIEREGTAVINASETGILDLGKWNLPLDRAIDKDLSGGMNGDNGTDASAVRQGPRVQRRHLAGNTQS